LSKGWGGTTIFQYFVKGSKGGKKGEETVPTRLSQLKGGLMRKVEGCQPKKKKGGLKQAKNCFPHAGKKEKGIGGGL